MHLLIALLIPSSTSPGPHSRDTAAIATATSSSNSSSNIQSVGGDEGLLRVMRSNAASFLSTSIPSSSSLSTQLDPRNIKRDEEASRHEQEVGGGVVLLVDLLSTALETLSGPSSSPDDKELPKEWFWFPPDGDINCNEETIGGGGGGGGAGLPKGATPISKLEITILFSQGRMNPLSEVWADGMDRPRPLGSIRELRWTISSSSSSASHSRGLNEIPRMSLKLLTGLAMSQPSYDSTSGAPLVPWPR